MKSPRVLFLIGATLLGACSQITAGHAPNVIILLADDLGYADVQCLNPQCGKIATLHIDRLASQGMVFTDANSTSSVCTPSRYSILTGRYNWRSTLQRRVLYPFAAPLISEHRLTLPAFLRQQPDIVERLTELLDSAVAQGRTTPGPGQTNDAEVNIQSKGK